MNRTTLGAFLKLIPTYPASMPVANWLGSWSGVQTSEGAMMLLDAFRCPQALVNGWAILAQVQQDPTLTALTLSDPQFQAWTRPMISVRADLTVGEWLKTQFPTSPDAVALVSLDGQYLGLLDFGGLVRNCLMLELNRRSSDATEIPPELFQAWEALAWPVLIQTGEGEVIWQNSAWQSQLGSGGIALNLAQDGSRSGFNGPGKKGSRWQFYPLPLSSHHGILATAQILKTQPELLPALCLTGLGESLLNSLKVAPATAVSLWLVLGLEIPHLEPWTEELTANLTALRQRYQQQQLFLATLNHELKNPVTSLLSLTQLLQQAEQEYWELSTQECLSLMERASRQLSFLLNQWLELTEAAQGNLDLTWEPLAFSLLISQAQSWLSQQFPSFGGDLTPTQFNQRLQQLHIEIPPGLALISGDRLRLRQSIGYVLMALMGIGTQETQEGGGWGCRVQQWSGWQELQIWQRGRGLSLAAQSHFLDMMPGAETVGAGMGLGVILARQLVRLHGGELSFWATDGDTEAGLEFRILLPTTLDHQGQLILLYGHDPAWLGQLGDFWAGLGYATAIARQDLELLDKSRQLHPQAIVLDPRLYQASGQQLLLASLRNLLRAMPETAHIPLISWSQTNTSEPNSGLYLLSDPEDLSELAALIEQLATAESGQPSPPRTTAPPISQTPIASTTVLTVLRLGATHAFTPQLHRFLEAADLEQGQLLAEIWQPDILLWDLPIPAGLSELTTLPHYPLLAGLPLVTLDEQMTRQAYQIPGVSVYPCLDVTLLGQVIERAWRHSTT